MDTRQIIELTIEVTIEVETFLEETEALPRVSNVSTVCQKNITLSGYQVITGFCILQVNVNVQNVRAAVPNPKETTDPRREPPVRPRPRGITDTPPRNKPAGGERPATPIPRRVGTLTRCPSRSPTPAKVQVGSGGRTGGWWGRRWGAALAAAVQRLPCMAGPGRPQPCRRPARRRQVSQSVVSLQ